MLRTLATTLKILGTVLAIAGVGLVLDALADLRRPPRPKPGEPLPWNRTYYLDGGRRPDAYLPPDLIRAQREDLERKAAEYRRTHPAYVGTTYDDDY